MDCLPIVPATVDDCIRTLFPGDNQMKRSYLTSPLTHPTFSKPATIANTSNQSDLSWRPLRRTRGKKKRGERMERGTRETNIAEREGEMRGWGMQTGAISKLWLDVRPLIKSTRSMLSSGIKTCPFLSPSLSVFKALALPTIHYFNTPPLFPQEDFSFIFWHLFLSFIRSLSNSRYLTVIRHPITAVPSDQGKACARVYMCVCVYESVCVRVSWASDPRWCLLLP